MLRLDLFSMMWIFGILFSFFCEIVLWMGGEVVFGLWGEYCE